MKNNYMNISNDETSQNKIWTSLREENLLREADSLLIAVKKNTISTNANGPGDLGSIPGRVIPKTFKMVLDTSLLNTQQYKIRMKGKVDQSREWSSALPYTSV